MRILCVHGFGGKTHDHAETAAVIRSTSQRLRNLAVETYAWDSGRVARKTVVADWMDAQERVKAEGPRLATAIRDWNEDLIVVAFSLGCWLTLEAILANERQVPASVSAIYFLGAAVPHNYPLRDFRWPAGFHFVNYFSPRADWILRKAWRNAQGIPSAGELGFADGFAARAPVANLRVHRSHKAAFNYKAIAAAVAELICYQQGYRSAESVSRDKSPTRVMGGYTWWDQILRQDAFMIQRHSLWPWGQYRLLDERSSERLAWSRSLAALLANLDSLRGSP